MPYGALKRLEIARALGDRAEAAAARRAGRRPQSDRGAGARRPDRQAHRARRHRGAGGAQHAAGDGRVGPHPGARLRAQARRRPGARGAQRSEGDRGLSGQRARTTALGDIASAVAAAWRCTDDARGRGLGSHYGRIPALKGIDLQVGEGELVALVGANGAGKTTLLRALSGVQPVSAGRVRFEGEDITARRAGQARAPRHRAGARGAAGVRAAFGRGQSAPGRLPAQQGGGGAGHRARLRDVPGAEAEAPRAGGHAVRRPAADARHGPRPDGPAAAAAAR